MKSAISLSFLALTLAALAACESDPAPAAAAASSTATAMPLSEFVTKYIDKRCVTLASCSNFSTPARCKLDLAGLEGEAKAGVAAGEVKFDGTKAQACLDATTCDSQKPSSCDAVFPGTAPAGGDCSKASCAPGNQCTTTNGCSRCKAMGAIGSECVFGAADCISGTCIAGKCAAAPAKAGDACDWDCPGGLACIGNKCGPKLKAGALCSSYQDCEPGLACWKAENATATDEAKCTATAKVGGDCTKLPCDFGDVDCVDVGGGAKTCKALGFKGDACSETSPCYDGLTCNAATKLCTKVTNGAAGVACSNGSDCATGLFCDWSGDSTCKAKTANDKPCSNDSDCQSDFCGSEKKCAVPKCG